MPTVSAAAVASMSATATSAPSAANSRARGTPDAGPRAGDEADLAREAGCHERRHRGDRPGPRGAVREPEAFERLGSHRDAVAGRCRGDVPTAADRRRVHEVLVQVVHVFHDPVLEGAADRDVVEDREVLDILAETDAARVRADRDPELGRQQLDRQDFVDAAQAAAVELAEADGLGLQELLEHDPILAMLAGGHADPERARALARSGHVRGRHRGWSAPRSTTVGRVRARVPNRWPGRRPMPGWRRS